MCPDFFSPQQNLVRQMVSPRENEPTIDHDRLISEGVGLVPLGIADKVAQSGRTHELIHPAGRDRRLAEKKAVVHTNMAIST